MRLLCFFVSRNDVKKIIIGGVVLFLALGLYFKAKAQDNLDIDTLKGRAVELANFAPNERVVKPNIIYRAPGESASPEINLDPSVRRVVIFDAGWGIGGVEATFQSPEFTINDAGNITKVRNFKKSVGDILLSEGIILAKQDKVTPDIPADPLGQEIRITRVTDADVEEIEPVPYQTKKTDDPTLDRGKQRVEQKGINGEKTLTYRVRRENGSEVSRTLTKSEVTKKPQDELIKVGTKPVITVRCRYNDTVASAAAKYNLDPNMLCGLMIKESNGNAQSDGGQYKGLYQFDIDFWPSASAKAGYGGASWTDAEAQIYTAAYYISIGQGYRWGL